MLATPIEDRTLESFEDGNWWLEEKFDGHRVIVAIRLNGSVAAWSRPRAGKTDGLPRTLPPHILEVLRFFPPMTIDAELVMPGGNSWNVVDTERQHELELIIFDVLQVDGRDVTGETASTRREYVDALQVGLREAGAALVRASKAWLPRAHYDRAGNTMVGFKLPTFRELVADIWRGGGEGAILKRKDGLYRPGYRSQDWIKVKRLESATMLIVGFQQGLLGPYSVTLIHDDTNGVTSSVKTKDNDTMRLIAENPEAFIGRRLRIEHQGMFKGPKGLKPRHPMWDHLID